MTALTAHLFAQAYFYTMKNGATMISKTEVRRILVPVSLDAASEKVILFASNVAKLMGAELILLHCTNNYSLTFTQQSSAIHILRSLGERTLLRHHNSKEVPVAFDCVVRPGTLLQCIKSVVQDYNVDLVVAETNLMQQTDGEAATIQEVLGCPVMFVPAFSYPNSLSHFVFATDVTDRDERVLLRIASFARQAGAKLTLLHVYTKSQPNTRTQLKLAVQDIQQLLSGFDVNYRLLEEEDILEGISEFTGQEAADLLILATQDTYLLQRLYSNAYVKTMAYHTQIPLLAYKQLKRKPCSGCCENCKAKQPDTVSSSEFLPLQVESIQL